MKHLVFPCICDKCKNESLCMVLWKFWLPLALGQTPCQSFLAVFFTPACHTDIFMFSVLWCKMVGQYCYKSVNVSAIWLGPWMMSKFVRSREEGEGLKGISGKHNRAGFTEAWKSVLVWDGGAGIVQHGHCSVGSVGEGCLGGAIQDLKQCLWKCFINHSGPTMRHPVLTG